MIKIQFLVRAEVFLFTTASTLPLGPTKPPTQWEPSADFLWVKQLGHEACHSPPLNSEANNARGHTFTLPYT
jgi:hypothetical protein